MGALGEILRTHGPEYRARFAERMSLDQLKAMRAIEMCHTPAAGKALWSCPDCGAQHFTFLGCGNRHCPACGTTRAAQWLRNHCALLLPECTYHLVTFTVPAQLRRTIRSHPRELLDLLMRLSASVLLDLCENPRWIGATPGLSAVLHTWTRQLEYHPHVHVIATGGGLASDGQWHKAHPRFLVPVHALSAVMRARFRDELSQGFPEIFATLPAKLWTQDWVVHSKPVGSGHLALRYLSRYVHRVAISEQAILHHDENLVTIRYRRSDTNAPRTMRLAPQEFLRRFLQHVLPSQFRKIRYFGLHHSSRRPLLRLLQASMAWTAGQTPPQPPSDPEPLRPLCPDCNAPMNFEQRVPVQTELWRPSPLARPRAPP